MGIITVDRAGTAATAVAVELRPWMGGTLRDHLLSLTLPEILARAASLGVPPSALMHLLD